ncbi:unnamed protein product, partial [Closterium sp. Naga37s-1]
MAVPQRLQDLCALLYRAITRAAVGNLPVRALLLLALAVVVSLVVWAAPWPAATLDMLASPSPTSAELYEAWAHLFALDSPVPPPAIAMPASLPPAPHLEDCAVRTALRLASEHTGARQTAAGNGEEEERGEGEAPEWARASAACGNVPQPPWVRGADAANLGSTREVQRDLWAHQFPPGSCEGRRLLLVHWPHLPLPPQDDHGSSNANRNLTQNSSLTQDSSNNSNNSSGSGGDSSSRDEESSSTSGSSSSGGESGFWSVTSASVVAEQLAAMAGALSVAVSSRRVLVPMPGSFLPANHPHCHAVNESGSLHCYFVRSVSPACEAAAMQQYRLAASPPCRPLAQLTSALASNDSLVCALATLHPSSRPDSAAARAWGNAYKQRPYLVEERGVMVNATEEHMQAYWWQAQALRFLLRWPSALLCHATNRMRHSAYGLQAAEHSAEYMKEQREIVTALRSDPPDPNPGVHLRAEAAILTTRDYTKHPNLETEVWPGLGYAGCGYASETGGAGEDRGGREAEKVGGTGGGGWTIGSWTIGGWSIASWGIGAADEEDVVEEKPAPLLMYERVGREVAMPRPVVSMHVEHQAPGHAGASADVLLPLLSLAYRLRQHDPTLQFAWLSADDL